MMFVPSRMFLTKGVGMHRQKLSSFELALRNADIAPYNIVAVSSILPPSCRIIGREDGLKYLKHGQILYCVRAQESTNEPNRLIAAAIGVAIPQDKENVYGYLSEHHAFGQTGKQAGEYAEDLAATMLGTTLGIELNPDTAWQEREQVYRQDDRIFRTRNIYQSAEGHKEGLWTTVIAAAVFLD